MKLGILIRRLSLLILSLLLGSNTAVLTASASTCSLADHIRSANTNTSVGGCPQGTSHDVITIGEDIRLSEALPAIRGTITIEGNGHAISGDGKFRIFDVGSGGRLRLKNLTLTEGSALDADGGAIRLRNDAQVRIENSSFIKNSAGRGGAIATSDDNTSLTVRQSVFRINSAGSDGGAVLANGAQVDIRGSSFVFNRVRSDGGAIATLSGRVSVSNSSFFRNQAFNGGGVFVSGGETTLTHVTMVINMGFGPGGSLYKSAGRLYVRNSIIQDLRRQGWLAESCEGILDQSVGNLSRDGTCAEAVAGDAMLEGMTGWPAYFPLKDRSPAVDAADPQFCPETDQVGTARPQGSACDIGAIEGIDALPPLPQFEPPPPCPLALRIVAANTDAPAGVCPAGEGHDVITLTEDITLDRELPPITGPLTIEGNGHRISGRDRFRIFTVSAETLTIKNLTLVDGTPRDGGWGTVHSVGDGAIHHIEGSGGAIRIEGSATVVIEDSSFISNSADYGGAIATEGVETTLRVKNSRFRSNGAGPGGGAILVNGGAVDISGSSFEFNRAGLFGGAIEILHGSVTISNSRFQANSARQGGAILVGGGETTLTHLTLVDNHAQEGGGSVSRKGGQLAMRNSIVDTNDLTGQCVGGFQQSSGNLSQDGSCADGVALDPLLDRNSESPEYFPLKPGSPAIDAADARYCLETDQLGRARPQGGGCDIGAIESPADRPAQLGSGSGAKGISTCEVTTTHVLNFRDDPGGAIFGAVPQSATLRVAARTPHWFQVEYRGETGWISVDYVVMQGDCG